MEQIKEKQISVSPPTWKYSTYLLSACIESRYAFYDKEALIILGGWTKNSSAEGGDAAVDDNAVLSVRKDQVMMHLDALNRFLKELHTQILQSLKVTLPKDLKEHMIYLRKLGSKEIHQVEKREQILCVFDEFDEISSYPSFQIPNLVSTSTQIPNEHFSINSSTSEFED